MILCVKIYESAGEKLGNHDFCYSHRMFEANQLKLLKKRKRFKFERRLTLLPWCFGFSAVSNEYIKTPEDTTRDNTYTVTIASITTQPPSWRYLLFFELVHYSRMRHKHQDIVLLIPS